jgi:pimeloyl-ACP methyl ester carboxylesterase
MNRCFTLFFLFLVCGFAYSQADVSGQWKSSVQGLDIYIEVQDELFLTIPAQGILKSKADNFENSSRQIDFYFQLYGATFVGQYENDTISGQWKQRGRSIDLDFVRNSDDIEIKRSQEPLAEINYVSEDVRFPSSGEDGYLLAGTITKPEGDGPFPAIVLVSGSGPQNRDSEIFNHKPFLILADYFTRKGYLVLRYDDRGVGESKGYFAKVTTKDLSEDTDGAIEYLMKRPEVNTEKLGIMGHSEGGMIAPMVASTNEFVDFIVLIAGPGQDVRYLMEYQLNASYGRIEGLSEEGLGKAKKFNYDLISLVIQNLPNDQLVDQLRQLTAAFYLSLSDEDQKLIAPSEERFYFQIAPSMLNAYMKYFLAFKPSEYLTKVTIPTLALNGKKDVQVTWKENINAIKEAYKVSGNKKNLKTITYKDLNHLFQTSETGEGSEYFTNQETFNEEAMNDILEWLNNL